MSEQETSHSQLLQLTTEIVAAHVSNNALPVSELPATIRMIYGELAGLGTPKEEPQAAPTPAVPIRKSVTDDHIVCLEDGKKLKMLKRHLSTAYGMTPDEYRAKWGLPLDYPMVAPAYSRTRQQLAKDIGLGRKPAANTRKRGKAA